MKVWIHQIKESMEWQDRNCKLLHEEYLAEPTTERLTAYIESYGKFMKLAGQYEQWHIDAKEVKAGTF